MSRRHRSSSEESGAGNQWRSLLGGLGLGSLLAYLFDPRLGRARRARARDRAAHAQREGRRVVLKTQHDLTNRAHGMLARLRAAIRDEEALDEVLEQRVRASLGRVCSHSSALQITAAQGRVTLAGPVLEREHAKVIRAVRHARGVKHVEDQLERHLEPSHVPGLEERQRGWPATTAGSSHRCASIMKRTLQTVGPEDTIATAAAKMATANVGFLPVCAFDGQVLGTITDRDIVVRVLAREIDPAGCHVGQVMTTEIVACRPEDDLILAEQLMAQYQVSRMVITEDGGLLRGVISLSDVAQNEPARRAARTLRAIAAREAPRA